MIEETARRGYARCVRLGLVAVIVLVGWVANVANVANVATAKTGDALKPYIGRIVISPETPPTAASEIPAYLAANVVKGDEYDLIKGPPWPMHLVGVIPRDVAKPIKLVITDKADKKLAPLLEFDVSSKQRIVVAHTEATIAAGFAAGKTYVVRLMLGKTVLARSELTLRD
jgi:hypothetical protein